MHEMRSFNAYTTASSSAPSRQLLSADIPRSKNIPNQDWSKNMLPLTLQNFCNEKRAQMWRREDTRFATPYLSNG